MKKDRIISHIDHHHHHRLSQESGAKLVQVNIQRLTQTVNYSIMMRILIFYLGLATPLNNGSLNSTRVVDLASPVTKSHLMRKLCAV